MSDKPIALEAMLLRWSTTPKGQTVTFLLEDSDINPFRSYRSGPANGDRFMLAAARINDDETQTPVVTSIAEKPKSYAQRAAIMCENAAFGKYMDRRFGVSDHGETTADILRSFCNVESRKQIVEGSEAGRRFLELEADYGNWLKGL